jgi:Bacterial Ig-like domain
VKLHRLPFAFIIAGAFVLLTITLIAIHLTRANAAPTERATALSIVRMSPTPQEMGVATHATVDVFFTEHLKAHSVTAGNLMLQTGLGEPVAAHVSYEVGDFKANLRPLSPLHPGTTYRVIVRGGAGGVRGRLGQSIGATRSWSFTTGVAPGAFPRNGPGGPILVVTSALNGFSQYYPEILRAEGLNEFNVLDVAQLDRAPLKRYGVVLLGELSLSWQQISQLQSYVRRGGTLIAMHPDRGLARSLGLAASGEELKEAYLRIDPLSQYGAGLVHEPIQFHGTANLYEVRRGITVATLYTSATEPSRYPAVSVVKVGRGSAVVFAYDLARSVVYTRQGNPAWAGHEQDGLRPVRPDDLFYGNKVGDPQADWVDPQKIAIPQADEQQRLLANLILLLQANNMPLPRFWYLPRGAKAAIVMTGDDHGGGGTFGRLQSYVARDPPHCSADDWQCINATAYIFDGSIPVKRAATLVDEGFEIGLHLSTDCKNWMPSGGGERVRGGLDAIYQQQLAAFVATYPRLPPPATVRTHCIAWSDYDTQPQVELRHGIRLDTNYYFWPPKWVHNHPGLFTGSGMPMRFATVRGVPIDVYQAATQLTDESQQTYPYTIDTLLSNALGPSEYFGVFTANLHNDRRYSAAADSVVRAALANHVPVVSAAEMLQWLDGRNNSSFQHLQWTDGTLSFDIAVATGGSGAVALLPATVAAGDLSTLTLNGTEVRHEERGFAGLTYAAFSAGAGRYVATYRKTAESRRPLTLTTRRYAERN